jgi:hypothetical protein
MTIEFSASWATLSYSEKADWLNIHVLEENVVQPDFNMNEIVRCESVLTGSAKKLYLRNCTSFVSRKVYKGKTQEEISSKDTTAEFYLKLLTLDKNARGLCLSLAVKGDRL